MRRGITFSKKAYIFLAITALFNLMAIVFDQLVVQQEDKIRDFDQIVNEQKQEVNHNLYAHKIFNELFFKIHFNAKDLMYEMSYLVRATNFLNTDLPKKIEEDKIVKIKKIYIKKTKNIVNRFHKEVEDVKIIFNKVKKDKMFLKFIEKEKPPNEQFFNPVYLSNRIEKKLNKLLKKKEYDLLSNYNFNAKTIKEQSDNFLIYSRFYDDYYSNLTFLKFEFEDLSQSFKQEFNNSFTIYYILLDDFAALKNLKNYLILLSILFQIFGLVSLIILFRILITEHK